jgi:hypothetical protein
VLLLLGGWHFIGSRQALEELGGNCGRWALCSKTGRDVLGFRVGGNHPTVLFTSELRTSLCPAWVYFRQDLHLFYGVC